LYQTRVRGLSRSSIPLLNVEVERERIGTRITAFYDYLITFTLVPANCCTTFSFSDVVRAHDTLIGHWYAPMDARLTSLDISAPLHYTRLTSPTALQHDRRFPRVHGCGFHLPPPPPRTPAAASWRWTLHDMTCTGTSLPFSGAILWYNIFIHRFGNGRHWTACEHSFGDNANSAPPPTLSLGGCGLLLRHAAYCLATCLILTAGRTGRAGALILTLDFRLHHHHHGINRQAFITCVPDRLIPTNLHHTVGGRAFYGFVHRFHTARTTAALARAHDSLRRHSLLPRAPAHYYRTARIRCCASARTPPAASTALHCAKHSPCCNTAPRWNSAITPDVAAVLRMPAFSLRAVPCRTVRRLLSAYLPTRPPDAFCASPGAQNKLLLPDCSYTERTLAFSAGGDRTLGQANIPTTQACAVTATSLALPFIA